MRCPTLAKLSPAPLGKTGWPWTKENPQNPRTIPDDFSWPKVSIVTPSYNQGHFIEETIRSVLLQGYPNLEYIIVDGGSTDNSLGIIRRYKQWLAYWNSEQDSGQASAINKGFRHSTGEIMAWLNSDDCLLPGAIWHIVKTFRRLPQLQIVCGFRYLIDAQSNRLSCEVYPRPDKFTLSRVSYIPQETVFWRRSLWNQVGELDESYQFALDYEFWQRILAAGYRFYLIPRFIGMFRVHPSSKSESQLDLRSREQVRIYQHYLHTSRTESELFKDVGHTWWRRMYLLNSLAKKGVLNVPIVADVLVSMLSLNEKKVVSTSPASMVKQK